MENGNELLELNNGYLFRKEAKFKDQTDWVCLNNAVKENRCSARVTVNSERMLKLSRAKHNHKPKN